MSYAMRIKDFPNYYVTDSGDVYSRASGRIKKLKQDKLKSGYLMVSLCNNGKIKKHLVHRLVAQTFIPNPENKKEINHKNGIKTDNKVDNLEWSTRSENVLHTYYVLHRKPSKAFLGRVGKLHPNAKLVLQIKDGKVIAEFYGCREAERETGICAENICACCNGKHKKIGGYQWKYKE